MIIELAVTYKGEQTVLRVEDDDVIYFPQGLVGFPEWQRFVMLEDPDEAPVAVLQSVDDGAVSFLVTDPRCVCPDYSPDFGVETSAEIGLERLTDGRVLCILVVREGTVRVTANLLGPLVINPKTGTGIQIVLQDSRYSAQYPVLVAEPTL